MSKKNKKTKHGHGKGASAATQATRTQPPRSPAAAAQASAPAATSASAEPPTKRSLRRDQERAVTAYRWAAAANDPDQYEIAVQSFAGALMRSGFAVAVSVLERSADRDGYAKLLQNLAAYPLPGLRPVEWQQWPSNVRALADTSQYMQATRELLALLSWLRRACRAHGAMPAAAGPKAAPANSQGEGQTP